MKKKPNRRSMDPLPLPLMMAELAFASWETMTRRSLMIAQGTCTAAEWQRMMAEKASAAEQSLAAFAKPFDENTLTAAIAPWHSRAKANAARLRRK